MSRIKINTCPLCGLEANVLENEWTEIKCNKCGNYSVHISVHPLLFEIEKRNTDILRILSEKTEMAFKNKEEVKIDLMYYQEVEKTIYGK